jgi:hypothetical protein
MKYLSIVAIFASSVLPVYGQMVTMDKIPSSSGCSTLPTYERGVNVRITVRTNEKSDDPELEKTLAQDISRFKDTNSVTPNNDPVAPIGKRPIEFEATVFWGEIKGEDGSVLGYAASNFITETCAVFEHENDHVPGFSTHVLFVSGVMMHPSREKLLDTVEKGIYDALIATVRRRRAARVGATNSE